MKKVSLLGAALALMCMAGTSRADFAATFEDVATTGGYKTFTAGMTVDGFTVAAGSSVDVVASPYATIGAKALDTIGTNTGAVNTISATTATVLGQAYFFTISYSLNVFPSSGSSTYTADTSVSVSGGGAGFFTVMTKSTPDVSYMTKTYSFIGDGTTTTISIASIDGGTNAGIIVDNVFLTSVPEPASMALLGMGAVGGLGLIRRRRKSA